MAFELTDFALKLAYPESGRAIRKPVNEKSFCARPLCGSRSDSGCVLALSCREPDPFQDGLEVRPVSAEKVYLRRWAAYLKVQDLLEIVLAEVGL